VIRVTGAAGFVGRHVCSLLSGQGAELLAVDRVCRGPVAWQTATGELTDDAFLSALFAGRRIDLVIHLASLLNGASRRQPQEALRVNVGASLSLIELAVRTRVGRFVYGSSISAYGTRRLAEGARVSEAEPAAPTDVYGVTKRYVEIVGETSHRQGALGFVSLRMPIVVGADASGTASPWRSRDAPEPSSRFRFDPTSGSRWRTWRTWRR